MRACGLSYADVNEYGQNERWIDLAVQCLNYNSTSTDRSPITPLQVIPHLYESKNGTLLTFPPSPIFYMHLSHPNQSPLV